MTRSIDSQKNGELIRGSLKERSLKGPRVNAINLVLTLNRQYFQYFMVAIKSLLDNFHNPAGSPYDVIRIHIIETDFTEQDKELAKEELKLEGLGVELIFIRYRMQDKYPGARYKNIEIVTLVYDLPALIPDQSKILFLDADLLVLGSIHELWEQELGHCWFAAAPCILNDEALKVYNRTTKGHFWSHKDTINAGMMLFDLDAMRKQDVSQTLHEWTEANYRELRLPEQEALAFNFAGSRAQIEHKWNWCGALAAAAPYWSLKPCEALEKYHNMEDIKVVHFPGSLRPDRLIIKCQYFRIWDKYYKQMKMPKLKPGPIPFMSFCNLMTKDKTKWNYIPLIRNIKLLPLFIYCMFHYVRYLKKPENFTFRTFN